MKNEEARSGRQGWLMLVAMALVAMLMVRVAATTAEVATSELLISEYIEGSSNNKALEIYNGTGAAVDLTAGSYNVQMYFNGGATAGLTINLAGTVADGDVFVLAHSSASAVILAQADQTNGSGWFNGDDAAVLRKGTTIVDAIGQVGFDPGAEWGAGLTSTADNTLRRSASVCQGDTVATDAFDPSVEWSGLATDTFDGLGAHVAVCGDADIAPTVIGTSPIADATGVPIAANIAVDFSELVDVEAGAVAVECPAGTPVAQSAAATGVTQVTVDPAVDLPFETVCTVTVHAALVSDADAIDPPDTLVSDLSFSFTTISADVCTAAFTPIYDIQGSGASAAITGVVTTMGVVVGDFQGNSPGLQGFYLQDATGDSDAATSDGIFVFTGGSDTVAAGDLVRVTGFARERFNQTTLNGSNSNTAAVPDASIVLCGTGAVGPTDVMLPANLEQYEGMLVRLPQDLVIAEYFNYERFGEMVLALPLDGEDRPFTGTALDEPGADANARTAANMARRITLDDGRGDQNPPVLRHPNGADFSLTNRFRGGDLVTDTLGVLGFDFSLYRIQPTGPATYTSVNPRQEAPSPVGGSLRVSGLNTLNYFLTGDYPTGDPLDNTCGALQNLECRGHDTDQPLEFSRQREKLLQALIGINGDIVGLNEIENTPGVEPLADIVAGLNALLGAGTYAYIDTGVIGTDAIRVGIIYKPAKVTPLGVFEILDSSVNPRFIDTKNRPVLAQSFRQNNNGSVLTVAVTHLKSKGSDCNDVGDPDLGDGQGNCSQTRRLAAEALVDWLATDPTGSGDPDYLIVGDMNSYAKEDSIDAVLAGPDDTPGTADDYTNLVLSKVGDEAYSYVFDGQFGYLDHGLASASLAPQVTGLTEWHINADEPDIFDYDTTFKPAEQDALYEPNAFRTSDHDPVIVGLNLSVCAALGDDSSRFLPDTDGFTFQGRAGERVTIRVEQVDPTQTGRATLLVTGPLFLKLNASPLPNEVSGVLSFSGTYTILVSELTGSPRFSGDYCVRVTSTGGAEGMVVPTAITE